MTSPHASYRSDTEQRNPLIAGPRAVETKKYTVPTGATVALGAILGVVLGASPVAAAAAGNTGNGTMGPVTLGAGAKAGVYRVVIVEPGANAGAFLLEDPDGLIVGRGTVAVAFTGPVNFTLTDGATDFVAGDSFTITVAETGEVKTVTAAATDGTSRAAVIAAHAAAAEEEVLTYTHGDFAENLVSVGAGLTVAGVKDQLRARGIHLIAVASA